MRGTLNEVIHGKELPEVPWGAWGGTNCSLRLAFPVTNPENRISSQAINLRGVQVIQVGGRGGKTGREGGR